MAVTKTQQNQGHSLSEQSSLQEPEKETKRQHRLCCSYPFDPGPNSDRGVSLP